MTKKNEITINNSYFHDANVLDFYKIDSTIYLKLESAEDRNGNRIFALVKFEKVSHILIENKPSEDIKMFYEDGGIVNLELKKEGIALLIDWQAYNPRKSKMIFYLITAETASWQEINENS